MIAQNEINVQGELANKTNNRTVSYKLNKDACTIIPYPTVQEKHIWQVYVTSELKIKLFCFFTIRAMVWIFITVKNRYLNLSTVLKFSSTQNEPKRAETKKRNPQLVTEHARATPRHTVIGGS